MDKELLMTIGFIFKIDVFSSISGAINIGLTLSPDKHFDKIKIGDKVFKILNKS